MSSAVADLLRILDLEPIEANLFRGQNLSNGDQPRVFGGQVIAQALVAAMRTVDGLLPHSLHGYFLLAGDPKTPIDFEVDRIRDGRSFTTRRVLATQNDRAIFSLAASFHAEESGLDRQTSMPDVPAPDTLPSIADIRETILPQLPASVQRYYQRARPIELRPVDFGRYIGKAPYTGDRFNIWFRTNGPLPDDPAAHRSALAYASDMTVLDTSLMALGKTVFEPDIMGASLDHAIWFHRPFRADQWLLYSQDSPNVYGSRGLGRGLIYAQDGQLVASVVQEGLVRLRRDPTPTT